MTAHPAPDCSHWVQFAWGWIADDCQLGYKTSVKNAAYHITRTWKLVTKKSGRPQGSPLHEIIHIEPWIQGNWRRNCAADTAIIRKLYNRLTTHEYLNTYELYCHSHTDTLMKNKILKKSLTIFKRNVKIIEILKAHEFYGKSARILRISFFCSSELIRTPSEPSVAACGSSF